MTILEEAKKQLSNEAREYKVKIARNVFERIEETNKNIAGYKEKLKTYNQVLKDLEHMTRDGLRAKYGSMDL